MFLIFLPPFLYTGFNSFPLVILMQKYMSILPMHTFIWWFWIAKSSNKVMVLSALHEFLYISIYIADMVYLSSEAWVHWRKKKRLNFVGSKTVGHGLKWSRGWGAARCLANISENVCNNALLEVIANKWHHKYGGMTVLTGLGYGLNCEKNSRLTQIHTHEF
jgi:hypothetical protein